MTMKSQKRNSTPNGMNWCWTTWITRHSSSWRWTESWTKCSTAQTLTTCSGSSMSTVCNFVHFIKVIMFVCLSDCLSICMSTYLSVFVEMEVLWGMFSTAKTSTTCSGSLISTVCKINAISRSNYVCMFYDCFSICLPVCLSLWRGTCNGVSAQQRRVWLDYMFLLFDEHWM